MNKKLLQAGFALLALAAGMQKCWAEFGGQDAKTFRAQADLSGWQYKVVRGVATTQGTPLVDIATSNITSMGAAPWGVLQNDPRSGQAATVADRGLSKAKAGNAFGGTDLLTFDSSGQFISAISGSYVVARAMEAANATGDIVTVDLIQPVRWPAVL